jgi:sortase A
MRRLLLCLGCVLTAGGALALSWYEYLQVDTVRTQETAGRVIDTRVHSARSLPPAVILAPRSGEPVGRIEIPRLHLSVLILEGTSAGILRTAAGHIRGTALPGTPGNCSVAAHRDTLFRPLKDVKPQDEIVVTTTFGSYKYIVDSTEIVDPNDVDVLRQTPDPELTLVTCYPFYYLGPAPKRFVVRARMRET